MRVWKRNKGISGGHRRREYGDGLHGYQHSLRTRVSEVEKGDERAVLTEEVAELRGHALPELAKGNLLVDGGGGGSSGRSSGSRSRGGGSSSSGGGYDGRRRGRTDRAGFAGA